MSSSGLDDDSSVLSDDDHLVLEDFLLSVGE